MEELIEIREQKIVDGDDERIQLAVEKAKEEGISYLEALNKYFFDKESSTHE